MTTQEVNRPLVTVLVCLYNGARFVAEALDSVFAQSCQAFNVVVIDDGSSDGGADLIARRYDDERVSVIRRPHAGLNVTRAASLAYATAPFAAFLDQDDVWMPAKLERQIDAARASNAALVFSDSLLIDEGGQTIGQWSRHHPFDAAQAVGADGHLELLRRGCFVCFSTALVRTEVAIAAGGFAERYRYAADYDLWLRLTRRHAMAYVDAPLTKYRVHATQFTQRHPEITLAEQVALLEPIWRSPTYPHAVRAAVGDNLLGQHWLALLAFMGRRDFTMTVRTAKRMLKYPDRIRDWVRDHLNRTPVGPRLESGALLFVRGREAARREIRRARLRARHAPRWALRQLRGGARRAARARSVSPPHVWIDGSALAAAQVGYFNLTSELIRALAQRDYVVHVTADDVGRTAIQSRLNGQCSRIQFEPPAWRRSPPRGRAPVANATEVVIWRGTFRWTDARRVAMVQDLTTRIHPELHTAGNVAEFEDFLQYVQHHATGIVTVSDASRRDILSSLPVCPTAVGVLPMPIHPQYIDPQGSEDAVRELGIRTPYVLCVGTIEPRKNLRRLVLAFERLRDGATRDHTLVLAGPEGWDDSFGEFLRGIDASRIQMPGYVPLAALPSLYHHASAVVYPSVYEGFGLPVLEAMCCSALVIASNVSSVPEVLGADALQFDPYDVDDISRALRTVLTFTPEAAASYRERNRRRALAHLERLRSEPPLPGLPPAPLVAPL